jgi:hypothetical protein
MPGDEEIQRSVDSWNIIYSGMYGEAKVEQGAQNKSYACLACLIVVITFNRFNQKAITTM